MLKAVLAGAALCLMLPLSAMAQNPHFTACTTVVFDGDVGVVGQIAGLGKQSTPLVVTVNATAVCVDATTVPPTVLDSVPVLDGNIFPPKNGNRKFLILIDTPFSLPCEPPAEIVFAGITACDVTHNICTACPLAAVPEAPEPE